MASLSRFIRNGNVLGDDRQQVPVNDVDFEAG